MLVEKSPMTFTPTAAARRHAPGGQVGEPEIDMRM
jgi:hypothetical protein